MLSPTSVRGPSSLANALAGRTAAEPASPLVSSAVNAVAIVAPLSRLIDAWLKLLAPA